MPPVHNINNSAAAGGSNGGNHRDILSSIPSDTPYRVYSTRSLTKMPQREQANEIFIQLLNITRPLLHRKQWKVQNLIEFYPRNPSLLGLNVNHGMKIMIRLRDANKPSSFLELESVLGTFLHELVHNEISAHSFEFYTMLDMIEGEVQSDMMKMGWFSLQQVPKTSVVYDWSNSKGQKLGSGNGGGGNRLGTGTGTGSSSGGSSGGSKVTLVNGVITSTTTNTTGVSGGSSKGRTLGTGTGTGSSSSGSNTGNKGEVYVNPNRPNRAQATRGNTQQHNPTIVNTTNTTTPSSSTSSSSQHALTRRELIARAAEQRVQTVSTITRVKDTIPVQDQGQGQGQAQGQRLGRHPLTDASKTTTNTKGPVKDNAIEVIDILDDDDVDHDRVYGGLYGLPTKRPADKDNEIITIDEGELFNKQHKDVLTQDLFKRHTSNSSSSGNAGSSSSSGSSKGWRERESMGCAASGGQSSSSSSAGVAGSSSDSTKGNKGYDDYDHSQFSNEEMDLTLSMTQEIEIDLTFEDDYANETMNLLHHRDDYDNVNNNAHVNWQSEQAQQSVNRASGEYDGMDQTTGEDEELFTFCPPCNPTASKRGWKQHDNIISNGEDSTHRSNSPSPNTVTKPIDDISTKKTSSSSGKKSVSFTTTTPSTTVLEEQTDKDNGKDDLAEVPLEVINDDIMNSGMLSATQPLLPLPSTVSSTSTTSVIPIYSKKRTRFDDSSFSSLEMNNKQYHGTSSSSRTAGVVSFVDMDADIPSWVLEDYARMYDTNTRSSSSSSIQRQVDFVDLTMIESPPPQSKYPKTNKQQQEETVWIDLS